jgi:hypothetical protein
MLATQEPPDGDFVAYIAALEKESAARMHAKSDVPMVDLAGEGRPRGGNRSVSESSATKAPATGMTSAPVIDRRQAEALVARLAHGSPGTTGAVVGLIVGIFLLLAWLASDSGGLPFLLGLGLVLWAITRLRRLRSERRDAPESRRALVAKVFGTPTNHS